MPMSAPKAAEQAHHCPFGQERRRIVVRRSPSAMQVPISLTRSRTLVIIVLEMLSTMITRDHDLDYEHLLGEQRNGLVIEVRHRCLIPGHKFQIVGLKLCSFLEYVIGLAGALQQH